MGWVILFFNSNFMQRQKVQSSSIDSIGYNSDSNILEIEFLNGRIYQFFNVPESIFNGMMSADSHGKYLNDNIKGIYNYKEI